MDARWACVHNKRGYSI